MAQRNSFAWWEEQFKEAGTSIGDIAEQISVLEEFATEIASDMDRFEKHIEKGPSPEEIREAQKAMKSIAKELLQTNFAWASAQAPDITEPMLAHLLDTVIDKFEATIVILADGSFEAVNLITDCNRDLGTVETWFDIVEAVRISSANSDAARMIGWRKLYDAAILGEVRKTNIGYGTTKKGNPKRKKSDTWNNPEWLTATYYTIIKDREGALNNTAGYWHFLEYGNLRRRSGGRYPYPKYGAPGAVSTTEKEVNRKGKEMGVGVTTFERKRTKGWHDRKKLLDKANALVRRLFKDLERMQNEQDMARLASNIRGMVTREIKDRFREYHGMDSLEELEWEDLHRLRDKIIDRIANYQDYSTERVSDPALPAGMRTKEMRLDVESYLQGTYFRDITIREIFYY